jgi:pyruvate/2-oxoglutarate dehydrogenase complex dihydrolipoamide acyltransferase (E2) component
MAKTTIKMPKLGETVDEVVIIEWVKSEGDRIEVGDVLVNVETDKVDTELPSPVAGTLVTQLVAEGDDVATGDPVCVIET